MLRPGLTILLLASFTPSFADEQSTFPGVRGLMSEEEFRETGLDKLSQEERDALDRWLLRYTAQDAPELQVSNDEVREAVAEAEIRTAITGDFNGWTGNTVFRLENGQVWRQRRAGRYFYNGDDREVVLRKNLLGFYELTHVAGDKTVGVSRVRQ